MSVALTTTSGRSPLAEAKISELVLPPASACLLRIRARCISKVTNSPSVMIIDYSDWWTEWVFYGRGKWGGGHPWWRQREGEIEMCCCAYEYIYINEYKWEMKRGGRQGREREQEGEAEGKPIKNRKVYLRKQMGVCLVLAERWDWVSLETRGFPSITKLRSGTQAYHTLEDFEKTTVVWHHLPSNVKDCHNM